MEAPHTPAPWSLDMARSPAKIAGADGCVLGHFFLTHPATKKRAPEFIRNARIAQAAPDMLAALRGIYTDDDGDGYTDAQNMANIRAILAQIDGEVA